jgi:hypothetical protein
VNTRKRPGGATARVQTFPKPSTYCDEDTGGSNRITSGVTRSGTREGCTLSIKTLGAGWGES